MTQQPDYLAEALALARADVDAEMGRRDTRTPSPPQHYTTEADGPPAVGIERDDAGRAILSPFDPRPTARHILSSHFAHPDAPTLINNRDQLWRWDGTRYAPYPTTALGELIYRETESALKRDRSGNLSPFSPTRNSTANIADALEKLTYSDLEDPSWIGPQPFKVDPANILSCAAGLFHLADGKLRRICNPTPRLFSSTALPFNVNPDAPIPTAWLCFLASVFGDDRETVALLQEWIGYCLTAQTAHQKIMLVIGPPRSGKGTIGRIMRALLGESNTVAPTLASLGTNFGLWPLLGKRLAVLSDARLSGRSDSAVVTERLLSISGEDPQTVDRKMLQPVTTQLTARLMILTNELPRLSDASGALSSRFIICHTPHSFLGKEDTALLPRLLSELPGILNWAIQGLDSLNRRGRFAQPPAGIELQNELEDLTSPIRVYVRDYCTVQAGASIDVKLAFAAWRGWCRDQGRDHAGDSARFGRDLRAAVPGLGTSRPRSTDGTRQRHFEGITLNLEGMAAASKEPESNAPYGGF